MCLRLRRQLFVNVCSYSQEEKTDYCKVEKIYAKYRDQDFRPTSLSGKRIGLEKSTSIGASKFSWRFNKGFAP